MSQSGLATTGGGGGGGATSFVTQSGTATPSGGIINVVANNNLSTSGSGNTITVNNNGQIVIRGPTIDKKVTGATSIFTTSASSSFVTTFVIIYAVDVVGVPNDNSINVGWTPTAYSDLITASSEITTGLFAAITPPVVIPPATDVFVNVPTADTGSTTNMQRIDIIGYYL